MEANEVADRCELCWKKLLVWEIGQCEAYARFRRPDVPAIRWLRPGCRCVGGVATRLTGVPGSHSPNH